MTGVGGAVVRGLAWLIRPVDPAEFVDSYWEQRPLAVERARPGYYQGLPRLDDVDGLITSTVVGDRAQNGRLVRTDRDGVLSERAFGLRGDGVPDIHEIYRRYDEGFTVVLNAIQWRSPVVAALCRTLEADLQHPVGANLYLTPRSAQGFRPHVDAHDVFVTQIHGTKQWRVGGVPSLTFPIADSPGTPIDAVPEPRDVLLEPGDVLYIPRGYAHEATTQDSSSLHLTIGVHAFTWADLLAEAVRLAAVDACELRRALPIGHLDRSLTDAQVSGLADRLAAMTGGSVLDAARLSLGSTLLQRQAAAAGHFGSLDGVADLSVDSVVDRGFQGPYRIRVDGERVVADYPGNYLSVPPFLAPALEYAAASRAFTIASIPGDLSDDDKVEFAARLISDGFLRVVSNRRDTT